MSNTLSAKKYFLKSNLKKYLTSLHILPLVLDFEKVKQLSIFTQIEPFKILYNINQHEFYTVLKIQY